MRVREPETSGQGPGAEQLSVVRASTAAAARIRPAYRDW